MTDQEIGGSHSATSDRLDRIEEALTTLLAANLRIATLLDEIEPLLKKYKKPAIRWAVRNGAE